MKTDQISTTVTIEPPQTVYIVGKPDDRAMQEALEHLGRVRQKRKDTLENIRDKNFDLFYDLFCAKQRIKKLEGLVVFLLVSAMTSYIFAVYVSVKLSYALTTTSP